MSDPSAQPHVDDSHDDELLGCFWAQMRHGRPLSPVQAQHLFYIGFRAGMASERAVAAEVLAIVAGGNKPHRTWLDRFRRRGVD